MESRAYDARNALSTRTVYGTGEISVTVPQTTSYSYDLDGRLVQQQAPNGDVTYRSYDLAGQVAAVQVSPSAITAQAMAAGLPAAAVYGYDLASQLTSQTDYNAYGHDLSYDGAGRLTQQVDSCPVCQVTPPALTTRLTTTPNGALVALSQQTTAGTVSSTALYTGADWLSAQTDGLGWTGYGYDAAGRLRQQTLLPGAVGLSLAASTLDLAGRETAVSESIAGATPQTTATYITYNGVDLPVTTTLPGGVQEVRGYDANSRLSSLRTQLPGQSNAYSYGYTAGGWTSVVTSSILNNVPIREDISHDAVGRVLTDTFSTSGGRQDVASYDGNNNLLRWASVLQASGAVVDSTTYSYSYTSGITPSTWLANELLSSIHTDSGGTVTTGYSYDPSGNTTSLTSTAGLSQTLDYDAAGRLSHVTTLSGNGSSQTRVSLGYNARGLRASYVVTTTGQPLPTLSESLLYRGNQVRQVVVSGSNVSLPYTETFLYRADGTPLELLRQVAGQAGTQRYWYVVDGRGSVVGLSDAGGTLQDTYLYLGLWGDLGPGGTEAVPQPLRLAGYWYDGWSASSQASDGLPWYWLSTRSYDPALKRYLQPDPSSQEGIRSYVYAQDNPVDRVDPSGLASDCSTGSSEGGASSQACGDAARTVRGGSGAGGTGAEVAPVNEAVQLALPGLELVADPAGPQYNKGMFSLRLSQGWQRRLRALVNPTDQIVYQLSDVAGETGETKMILKVGRTTGQRSIGRFEPYATAGGRLGLIIEANAWVVDLPENTSLGQVENTFRQTLLNVGEMLPWDNAILPGTTTPRLERPGSGIPFVYLAKPAELGYKWDSNPASQYFGFYLDGTGMPVPQYPDYYPRPLGLLPSGR